MTSGRRRLRFARALAGSALLALALVGCYDIPQPECGFRCGPNGACPEGYTCNTSDGRCHLNGSSPELVCGTPVDAAIDAAIVDAAPDAAIVETAASAAAIVETAASAAATAAAPR